MKSIRSLIASGIAATAMLAGNAGAQYAPMPGASAPQGPSKADLIADINKAADMIQEGTNKYCDAKYDGDKSKGEHTNADVAALVRGMISMPDKNPKFTLEAVHGLITHVASNDLTICFDKRVKDMTAANIPAEAGEVAKTHGIYGIIYPAATTLGFTPKPVDAKDPSATSTAILFGFNGLAKRANQFDEVNTAAQMLSAMGHPQAQQAVAQARYIASTPFVYLYNPAVPEQATNGPSKDAGFLMENPIIKAPAEEAAPPAVRQPTGLRTGLYI